VSYDCRGISFLSSTSLSVFSGEMTLPWNLLALTARLQPVARAPHGLAPVAGAGASARSFDVRFGIVMPTALHADHFSRACDLVSSAAENTAAKVYVVFSSQADSAHFLASYSWLDVDMSIDFARLAAVQVSGLHVPVPSEFASNPITYKRWRALERLFRATPAKHLVAIDDEARVRRRAPGAPDWEWFLARRAWNREVLAGLPRLKESSTSLKQVIMRESCRVIGDAPLIGYAWWSDAPVYDREDFFDFYARIDWRRARMWQVFDALAYACYKVWQRGWRLTFVEKNLELMPCNGQETVARATNHTFMWAFGPSNCPTGASRFMEFHLDRQQNKDVSYAHQQCAPSSGSHAAVGGEVNTSRAMASLSSRSAASAR